MKVLKGLLSLYSVRFPTALVYMLQSTEYQVPAYLAWLWRTSNYSSVMTRRTLDKTKAANLLLAALRTGIVLEVVLGLTLIIGGYRAQSTGAVLAGVVLLASYPVIWSHLVVIPLVLGRIFISRPAEKRLISESVKIFANHPGAKIAVAGSYGKTTMKELLATVLSEGLDVAATPANKNVSSSHA
ncbi:hypothetical protein H7Y63_00735, partial [Polaromonas sp.]|nr:hypothetical protein [Candidatus Saccharibacteria bacterium]